MRQQYIIVVLLAALCMMSCKEEDNTVQEYANWQAKNEAYFEQAYAEYSSGTNGKMLLKRLTLSDSISITDANHDDCILVDVIESGINDGTRPLYSSTVYVHYRGWLIPSPSYPLGYQFDSSYLNEFDAEVAEPAELKVNSLVEGFSLALQHMSRGDHWRITIPYALGYGETGSGTTVPGYSTLIFELWLDDFE